MKVGHKFESKLALTHFWPDAGYYHGVLAATELAPVTGVEVAKPNSGHLIKWIFAWFNNQVVAETNADYPLLGSSKSVDGHYITT